MNILRSIKNWINAKIYEAVWWWHMVFVCVKLAGGRWFVFRATPTWAITRLIAVIEIGQSEYPEYKDDALYCTLLDGAREEISLRERRNAL